MARSSTTYDKKWQSGKTTVIRVPESLAKDLLHLARIIDGKGKFQVREDANSLVLDILPTRRVFYSASSPINVSSVPQRSPFRYPGGKTWLIPYIRDWLSSKKEKPAHLIEPFAGGAIISMTVGFEGLAKHVIFNELDPAVAAVWKVILNGQSEWLAQSIVEFDLNETDVRRILNGRPKTERDLAFQTILRNRVQRGGIMAPGAGLVRTGENGRGLNSRWYPETLARRIREINMAKSRFTFVAGDAFDLINKYKADPSVCYYVDPPYTQAARRLYVAWKVDHALLFQALSECRGDFLMSYDNTNEVVSLAQKFGFESRPIAMKSTHHAKMTELLIGRDLSWLEV
jgi:DNA adenine methylase